MFSLKIRLEIRFKNVPDRKETFWSVKTKLYKVPKNCIFPKGLIHGFDKKCQIFLYLDLVKIRLEKVSNNTLEKKETFFLL